MNRLLLLPQALKMIALRIPKVMKKILLFFMLVVRTLFDKFMGQGHTRQNYKGCSETPVTATSRFLLKRRICRSLDIHSASRLDRNGMCRMGCWVRWSFDKVWLIVKSASVGMSRLLGEVLLRRDLGVRVSRFRLERFHSCLYIFALRRFLIRAFWTSWLFWLRIGFLARRIMSIPIWILGINGATAALNRRFARLRWTAFPTDLLTVVPMRISLVWFSRKINTTNGWANDLPDCRTCLKSSDFFKRKRDFNLPR